MCNLSKALEQYEHELRRVAYRLVANSREQIQWANAALYIQRYNLDHVDSCPTCQANLPKVAA